MWIFQKQADLKVEAVFNFSGPSGKTYEVEAVVKQLHCL